MYKHKFQASESRQITQAYDQITMQRLWNKLQMQLFIAYWVNAFIGWQVEIYSWERINFLNFENKHF